SCSGMSAEQRAQAAEIHQQLGDNLLYQGDAQGAIKEYMQSLDLDETPEAHNGLGLIYWYSLGRGDDGAKEFKRALQMRPDFSEAMTNLGALYISRNQFTDAIPLLDKAPRDPQAGAGQADRLRVCALPQGARDALRPAMVDSRRMEILEMLERTPAIVAGIAAQVPESLVRVRSGPFALVEHVWHLGDLE